MDACLSDSAENSGLQAKLESETRASKKIKKGTKTILLEVLRT